MLHGFIYAPTPDTFSNIICRVHRHYFA